MCGAVIIAVSHKFYALIVGRVFAGLGIGFGLAVRVQNEIAASYLQHVLGLTLSSSKSRLS